MYANNLITKDILLRIASSLRTFCVFANLLLVYCIFCFSINIFLNYFLRMTILFALSAGRSTAYWLYRFTRLRLINTAMQFHHKCNEGYWIYFSYFRTQFFIDIGRTTSLSTNLGCNIDIRYNDLYASRQIIYQW